MDCVEEDLHTAGISRYGITTGRQLQEIAGDRSQWRELVAASDILVLKLISVLVFILFSSQNFYFI